MIFEGLFSGSSLHFQIWKEEHFQLKIELQYGKSWKKLGMRVRIAGC